MTVEAFIAVGSNIDPEENILRALELLHRQVRVKAASTFYRTRPIERPRQADFRNGILLIETPTPAAELKIEILRFIESELGRVRMADKYAARVIDLDVILYGRMVQDSEILKLPDPSIRKRAFVAVPLAELSPELTLPDTGESVVSLAAARSKAGMHPDTKLTTEIRKKLSHERSAR